MTELSVIIGGFFANLVTSFLKERMPSKYELTVEEMDARKTVIRSLNLVFGVVGMVLSAYWLGEPLDLSSLSSALEALATIGITYIFSQGSYHLVKS